MPSICQSTLGTNPLGLNPPLFRGLAGANRAHVVQVLVKCLQLGKGKSGKSLAYFERTNEIADGGVYPVPAKAMALSGSSLGGLLCLPIANIPSSPLYET